MIIKINKSIVFKHYLTEKHQGRIPLACQKRFVFLNLIHQLKLLNRLGLGLIKDKPFTKQKSPSIKSIEKSATCRQTKFAKIEKSLID